MGGSILKKFKSDLQKHDLLRNQSKKKRNNQAFKDRREQDRKVLESIREAFNPFDIKKNRDKSATIGRTITGQVGRPGISKQIGEEQRKMTYEAQRKLKNKVGGVLDRRFGENDKSMTAEEKMIARYAREKMSKQTKTSMFNLEDDDNETLTHYGQALSMTDDFAEDDLGVSDEERLASGTFDNIHPDRKRRLMGDDAQEDVQEEEEPGRKKSKQEVMKEVIAKSKMHKAARQMAKEADQNVVEELNEQEAFDELMADLQEFDDSHKPNGDADEKDETYDQNVRELAYDRRAKPGDRTKTAEELEKEAQEKAKELTRLRQQRMEGDDLDDDFGDEFNDDAEAFGLKDTEGFEAGMESEEEEEPVEETKPSGPTIPIPQTLPELTRELRGTENGIARVRRIIQVNDASKAKGNKEKIGNLLLSVCKYASQETSINQFRGFLELLKENSEKYDELFGTYFKEAVYKIHSKVVAGRPLKTADLVTFAMIGALFSTSDQWHVVANGATLTITQHLSKTIDMTPASLAQDLFLCDILMFYQRLSKRFIPEVVALLLRGFSSVPETPAGDSYVRTSKDVLKLTKKFGALKPSALSLSNLNSLSVDEVVMQLVQVSDRAATLWKGSESFVESFEPISNALEALPENKRVKDVSTRLAKTISWAKQERRPLKLQDLRPVGIITHAPLFEDNYNPDVKNYDMDPERREVSKLRAELKRERKQTLKEIRRDSEFTTRERLQETRESAKQYHQNLDKIINQINTEEGAERNRYERERRARGKRK